MISYLYRYFRSEDSRESVIVHKIGNATADTELTFEYGVRTDKQHHSGMCVDKTDGNCLYIHCICCLIGKPLLIEGQPHLPFQLQIKYTNTDGDRCLRVITQSKPITNDRDVAEKGNAYTVPSRANGIKTF